VSRSLRRTGLQTVLGITALLGASSSSGAQPAASNARQQLSPFSQGPDRELMVRVCTPCHAPEQVTAKHHTADKWDVIIGRMIDRGAQANDAEQDRILAHLVRFYGP